MDPTYTVEEGCGLWLHKTSDSPDLPHKKGISN